MRPDGARPGLLARNTLLNLLGLGLPLLVAVAAMPAVVAGLGAARFGILALVWVVLGYVALLDLGLGRATTRFAADALTRNDVRAVAASVRVAAATQLGVGLLSAGALTLAVPWLVERVLRAPPELVSEARASFYWLAAVTPALLLTNTFRGLLEAKQRFDLVNAVRLPLSTGNFLLPLAGALLGWSLPFIVALLMLARVAGLAVYAGMAVRLFPGILGRTRLEPGEARTLLTFGGWVTVSALISPLLVYLDRFMIGGMLSLAAVGYYSAPHEIVMRATVLPAAVVSTLFPALSAGAGLPDRAAMGRLVAGAMKFLLVVAGPALVVLAVLGPDLLRLWLGDAFARESGLALRILAIGMLANTLAYVPGVLLQATGRPDLPARFHLLELPPHIAVLWVMVSAWGLPGAAAAWTIRMILDAALLYGASVRLGLLTRAELGEFRIPGTAALLTLLGAAAAAAAWLLPDESARLGTVAAMLIIAAVAGWNGLLSLGERRQIVAALRRGG